MIRVQAEDFDPGLELDRLGRNCAGRAGAVASFVGLVRGDDDLQAMTLEHYPGMTERQLEAMESTARRRWPLAGVSVIHRYGRLLPGERIVLVAVASAHRTAAFEACSFLMDKLKTAAPFWKLEERAGGARWVEAKEADQRRSDAWREE